MFFRVLQVLFAAVLSSTAWAQDTWDVEPVEPSPFTGPCPADAACFTGNDQLYVGMVTIIFGLVSMFFLARIMQARAIANGENATTGKHSGISLALVLTTIVMTGCIWAFTGGIPGGAYLMIGAAALLFVIHFAYSKTMA
jgi:hypothetical protein